MQLTPTVESKTKNHWRVVVVALFVGVIAAGHVGKLPPALPSIRTQLGLDIVTAGWLASMFSAIGAVAALFLGAIADQLNPWRLAVGGLVLMMVSGFLGSFATATSQLIISRFFEGVGFLAVVVAAPSIIGRATGGRARRVALGLWPAYMPVGVSLTMLAATMIVVSGVMMTLFAFGTFAIFLPDIARYLCSILLCGVGGVIASAAFAAVPSFAASPRQLGIVNGILVQASNIAQFVGPVGFAFCVAIFGGWESAVWAFIGVNVLLISVAALAIRHGRRSG